MSYKRFFKRCEEFSICGAMGDGVSQGCLETPDNLTIFHIVIRGKGRLCKPGKSDYVDLDEDENNFIDEKKFLGESRVYYNQSPHFHFYGFNPLKADQDWDGKLVKESFIGDSKSYLICFDGHPRVNGFEMKRMDYAKLTEKKYKLELNGGLLGMFTKNYGFNYEN